MAPERMLAPVVSSSLTTIAAFSPLLIVGGVIGSILKDIPVIVICVIVASLIECFLILPGHLQQSLNRGRRHEEGKIRQALDRGFVNFRDNVFKPFVGVILRAPALTLVTALTLFVLSVGLISGGRIKFTFSPQLTGPHCGLVRNSRPGRLLAKWINFSIILRSPHKQ